MSWFTQHPKDVKMSYFQHMGYGFSVASRMGMAAVCCFIHAIFPFLFTTTTSKIVNQLHTEFKERINHD